MNRIDLVETIERVTFPDEVWEWLDLFGEVIILTQEEALGHDLSGDFIADTPYKKILVSAINRDIKSLMSIYMLLRCEFINQAAAHVRLFCESLIILRYISLDKDHRPNLFNDYLLIEQYEILNAMLEWERDHADATTVDKCLALLEEKKPAYQKLKPLYCSTHKRKQRPFRNWCNKRIDEQAHDCGKNIEKLYKLVYKQMSAYIHGSAWSLRRQLSYSAMHYNPQIVHVDIATIVRTALGVWVEWAKFVDEELQWNLMERSINFINQVNVLDRKHFKDLNKLGGN
jgi:hypothetical protein